MYANHHHHQRGNAERNAIQQQLLGILEAGNAAGLWLFISLSLYLLVTFGNPASDQHGFVNTRHSIEFQETKYLIKMRFLVGIVFRE
ncbi:hypothetical protein [Streptococcus pneumoniae]|uniref:hypothetical protein n=1 Tax=Streptococcus pneumoniae TaxID=1313 RepID=UPI00344E1515